MRNNFTDFSSQCSHQTVS